MRIDTEAVKERLTLRYVWEELLRLDWPMRGAKVLCPVHEERTPSCNLYPRTNTFYCFGCQAGGDIFDLYQRVTGLTFRQALEDLARLAGVEAGDAPPPPRKPDPHRLFRQAELQACNEVGRYARRTQDLDLIDKIFADVDEIGRAYWAGELDADEAIKDLLGWRKWALAELEVVS